MNPSPPTSAGVRCHLGLGTLYRRIGNREQAQEHLGTVTALYREMDMGSWLDKAETGS